VQLQSRAWDDVVREYSVDEEEEKGDLWQRD
jgi:hypothetical protein